MSVAAAGRVLIAGDHPMIRSGLAHVVSAEPDLEVVGTAAHGVRAVELAEREKTAPLSGDCAWLRTTMTRDWALRTGRRRGSAASEVARRGVELFQQPGQVGQVGLRPVLERTLEASAAIVSGPLKDLVSTARQAQDVGTPVQRVGRAYSQSSLHQRLYLASDRRRVQLERAGECAEALGPFVGELAQDPVRGAIERDITVLSR
jgi:hypothetical protein